MDIAAAALDPDAEDEGLMINMETDKYMEDSNTSSQVSLSLLSLHD